MSITSSDREKVKVDIMEEIVYAQFTQHAELAEQLLATGDKILMKIQERICEKMTVFYKNDKIKISGDWNQGYCGEIPESYMEIPFPEEYKRFLLKHNGGNFLVEFENERVGLGNTLI